VVGRLEIFDAFCHGFVKVGGRLVNQCSGDYGVRLSGGLDVRFNWGDCLGILGYFRLRKISHVSGCSVIVRSGVDYRRWDIFQWVLFLLDWNDCRKLSKIGLRKLFSHVGGCSRIAQ
jgi:hypothetical protein